MRTEEERNQRYLESWLRIMADTLDVARKHSWILKSWYGGKWPHEQELSAKLEKMDEDITEYMMYLYRLAMDIQEKYPMEHEKETQTKS